MKKIYFLLFTAIVFIGSAAGQASSGNYVFATATNGSLTDMSTGTTQLIAATQDDAASTATNIGFDFWLMGTRYTQFSASSNGFIRLGGIAVSGGQYTLGTAATALIAAFGSDMYTSTSGKVHYKLTGSAPNRILIVEFKNITIIYDGAGATADGTYQVRLYEGTNQVEFAYGAMNRNSSTGYLAGMDPQWIGFSTGATDNTYATVTNASNTSNTTTAAASNQNPLSSAIVSLNSAADGSRRLYSYTAPSAPNPPSNLTFTGVSGAGMVLNWTDNSSDESGFAVYQSTDGITYNYVTTTAANATSYSASGLSTSTLYYWKVVNVREIPGSVFLSGSQSTSAGFGAITSNGTGGGLWSVPATWAGGVVPTAGDDVTILASDLVTEDVTAAVSHNLTVAGILEYESGTARTLTAGGDVLINAGGTFRTPLSASTVTTHVLSVGGNLTNNGTLNFSTNTNTAAAGITFTGAANAAFGGSGVTTNIRTMTINKGTSSASVLELNPTVFTVQNTVVDGAPMAFLTLTNGTFKISGSFTLAARLFSVAAYSIPATCGIWLNNPNFTVAGQAGSPANNGLLRLTQGTYNVGTGTGNSMGAAAGASYIIEGGAMNVTGRLLSNNAITYTQSAGTVTVVKVGNASTNSGGFQLGSSTSTFNMSGGTIIIVQRSTAALASRLDLAILSGTRNITGGTVQFGSAATATNFDFKMYGYAPNVIVDNTTNPKTLGLGTTYNIGIINGSLTLNPNTSFIGVAVTSGGELDVLGGNINIGTGATFNCNGSFIYTTSPSIINNGTFTGTGSGSVLYFGAAVAQTFSGTGTVTAALKQMSIDNVAGVTFSSTNPVIVDSVFLFNGSVTGSSLLTLGNGGATTAHIQIGNGTTPPTNAGVFDAAPVFNAGTGGVSLAYTRTTAARNTGFEVPVSRTISTLLVDENDATHPLTITGGDLTATGTFTYTNGNIITGSNTLISGASVAAPGTFTYTNGGIIIGNFKRWITATGTNWNFPVGIVGAKRNASIDFTLAPPTTGGTLTAAWISSPEGTNGLPLTEPNANGGETLTQTSADGYWSVVAADGLAGGTYTGTFTATGITSVAGYNRLVLIKRSSVAGSPWTLDGTYVTTTGTAAAPIISRAGMSNFSEFGIASDVLVVATNLTYFRGTKQGAANHLDWKVNVTGDPVSVSLQRSTDGRNFSSVYNTSATEASALNPFNYNDLNPIGTKDYYRLKMTELSGRVTYSNIVVLLNGTKGTEISVAPTVNNGVFNLNTSSVKAGTMIIMITDMSGQIVSKQMVTVTGGFTTVSMNVSNLAAGTYRIFGVNEDGKTNATAFIKE